jgi:hypothetical protein
VDWTFVGTASLASLENTFLRLRNSMPQRASPTGSLQRYRTREQYHAISVVTDVHLQKARRDFAAFEN